MAFVTWRATTELASWPRPGVETLHDGGPVDRVGQRLPHPAILERRRLQRVEEQQVHGGAELGVDGELAVALHRGDQRHRQVQHDVDGAARQRGHARGGSGTICHTRRWLAGLAPQ